ncbi:hypothetical protein [endosymbiont GvMRE of Glomus versiforme]|uniref:hypothetical protein n=1 Tax=endosymbiont GvMRE of Glomus versiforme TaxID=2039283 RepID=UPI000EBDFD0E|nr:hypothetical protein [endosymbiont GvMRE of Glomus versiforme]RHZ37631.1 hypothetical protein GvMRE_I1g374 [endosymbiont GvMRE of Glomus versiforme]
MKHNKRIQNSNTQKNITPFSYERKKDHESQFQEIKNPQPQLFKLDLQFFITKCKINFRF